MIKQTHAYRAALVLLADALARQDPSRGYDGYIEKATLSRDLIDLMEKRHPDFKAAMDGKVDEWAEDRKQAGIAKRRTTTQRRRARRMMVRGSSWQTMMMTTPTTPSCDWMTPAS